jgi:hypothetical protein
VDGGTIPSSFTLKLDAAGRLTEAYILGRGTLHLDWSSGDEPILYASPP